MGDARWSDKDWAGYAAGTAGKTRDAIYRAKGLHPDLDPLNVGVRESVDSASNPRSTPIIVALDVTGSMGRIPDALIRGPLGTVVGEILKRQPVNDPHFMFMGVGDADAFDTAPLQVTQFEADLKIADQLTHLFIEGRGGNNRHESYHLPWYFAAMHTRTDAALKRGAKGYLFTVGDEEAPPLLRAEQVKRVIGDDLQRDLTAAEVLAMAERTYHVFHIVVEEGSHFRGYGDAVMESWTALLGQRVIRLSDHTHLAEVIVSAIQATEGADRADVAKSWSGSAGLVVARAIGALPAPAGAGTGVVRL